MKLSDFIEFEAIVPNLSCETRDESIRELVMSLARVGRINEDKVDEITRDLIKRENQGSTGIGKGISVPHIKHSSVTEIVGTIGISKEGLDFSSFPINRGHLTPFYSPLIRGRNWHFRGPLILP